ncbi:EMILIN-2 [Astyanax mexicanus]|uniref:EMILIN-2 n=1 Tax=Astyanax mexicanus TaxID=7994 RepID=UPI0020CAA0D8|nr:EMILIN-2 [Astyanax mexicanus]
MKCVCCGDRGLLLMLMLMVMLMMVPLVHGTPSRFSLFQGSPYSSNPHQQRNKNWCAFVVHRNVTCAVLDTESVAPCPPHQPHCAQSLMYRTHMRPMYKIGYKQVTELEWRCCPGYRGHNCMELKDVPSSPQILQEPRPEISSIHGQQPSALGPEIFSGGRPWTHSGQSGQPQQPWIEGGDSGDSRLRGHQDSHRVQELEEEVQRLSQTVLDLQSAMTSNNANLRLDLQEDASKIILNLLGNLRQPQGALTGGTESILLPSDIPLFPATDELQNQVTHLSNTISTNTNSIQDLESKLLQLEGHVNKLTEVEGDTTVPLPSSASTTECPCQAYIDQKVEALRTELMEGMDIKMADLKNACDYKVLSVKEQCEEQENSYLSLAELLDSKEADLRQEIQDLRSFISTGAPYGSVVPDLQTKIQNLKNAHNNLASAVNATVLKQKTREDALEVRVSMAERGAEKCCLSLEEKLRRERAKEEEAQTKALESKINAALQVIGGTQSQARITGDANGQNIIEMDLQTEILRDDVNSLVEQVRNLDNSVKTLNQSLVHQNQMNNLYNRLDKLEEDCGKSQDFAKRLEEVLSGVDGRVSSIESVCGRLEPMSDSLMRIKDGLNKHVNGLWNCFRQLNSTVLTHSTDINTLRANTHITVGKPDGATSTPKYTGVQASKKDSDVAMATGSTPTVVEFGEAGPPGTKLSSRPPQGTNGSMTPVKGYAAAPGYPAMPPVSITPHILSGHTSESAAPASFSAGLTLLPFSGNVGIIRFNQVLLNDGGHYDPHTGIFTVPTNGRYLLSVVITAQKGERLEAVLSVANRSIQKLDTSGGVASAECLCGGSASANLVLDLKQGQKVAVVMTSGTLAISASTEALSTFSGVLLHPLPAKR